MGADDAVVIVAADDAGLEELLVALEARLIVNQSGLLGLRVASCWLTLAC